ncbi:MAG TPA: DNA polymerase IV [Abditibacteriaceae bacterium]|jgi:DNA polymerase-4
MPRTIIHVDLDAFYCAIEEQRDPALYGKPFAVGGQPGERGVVASCSYAARQFGVRSAMSMARARALCPQLLIVPSRHSAYRAASSQVMDRLRSVTPVVEQLSIDEAFLDVTALTSPHDISSDDISLGDTSAIQQSRCGQHLHAARVLAEQIQQDIRHELGLSCSLGVAGNKMVAKIATDYGKAAVKTGQSPGAICVVPPGEEAAFLARLPVSALWGVGPKTEAQLARLGMSTIGQVAQRSPRDLIQRFGSHGYDLWLHACGIDKREIVTTRESKSISSETTFVRDVEEWDELHQALHEQAVEVAGHLQRQQLQATTVKIKLRWSDFTTPTRQTTLPYPTDQQDAIEEAAIQLLRHLWQSQQPVRLLGVGVSGLSPVRQLSLWHDGGDAGKSTSAYDSATGPPPQESEKSETAVEHESCAAECAGNSQFVAVKQQRIQDAMHILQERYGKPVVRLGAVGIGTAKSTETQV